MRHDTARVPLSIWITTAILFAALCIYASTRYHYFLQHDSLPDFSPERLDTPGDNSVVIIGTSLIKHALPFDDELTEAANKHHLSLKFIRFTRSGNEYEPFLCLIEPLLKHPPRYLFLQAELFFLTYSRARKYHPGKVDRRPRLHTERLRFFYYTINSHYHNVTSLISRYTGEKSSPSPQSDDSIQRNLAKQADIEDVLKSKYYPEIVTASFPDTVTAFIKQLQQQGTRVFLLEANRSEEGNNALGVEFRTQLTQTFQQAAASNNLPYWQFPAIPVSYYRDRAHLNNRGRKVFTEWFLTRLANEYYHDGF